ncbi:MAG: DUF58 domain-containing protein [Desulfobacterales bacterium]|jgi:uncharacterized protein (DUF58 family)
MKRVFYWFYRWVFRVIAYLSRRFTPAGYFLLLLLVLSAIFGADTTLAMVFQIFTFAAFLLLIAFVLSLRMRLRFDVQRKLPRFVTAGRPFSYDVRIQNPSNRPCSDLQITDEFERSRLTYPEFFRGTTDSQLRKKSLTRKLGPSLWSSLLARKQGARREPAIRADLQPNESKNVRLQMLPVRRGRIRLAGITAARSDPLGLCYARKFMRLPQSILVLPKRYALPPVQLPGGRRHHSGGIALTTSVGESEEFVSLRDYRPGDPLRKFHWKSWARTGKPIVKEYQEEYFVRHVLILDTFIGELHSEAFEEAVSLAASFACTLQTQESLLDLIFVGLEVYCFTSGRGLGQTDKILEVLADVRPCDDKPFEAMFPTVISRAEFCSGCICIFVTWDEQRRKLVQLLRNLGLPVFVLVILEPDDPTIPDPGPMSDIAKNFHVLRAGEIEMGLEQI